MFYLTDILGLPVSDSSGARIGKVTELAAVVGTQPPRVTTILLKDASGESRAVPLDDIASLSDTQIQLNVAADAIRPFQPDEGLLLLRKDLLDQQIIDVHGRKVVRINDLSLEERPVNHHTELLIREADIGLRGAVHRLLVGAVPKTLLRKIEARVKTSTIPWDFVNLIEPDPLRRVKLNISHRALTELHPADLADIMEELSHKERQAVFSSLDDVTAAEALSEVDPDMQASIVESMDPTRAAGIIEEMAPDAAADLLGDLQEETSSELLEEMNQEEAAELGELLEFRENSAGGLMTTEYVALPSAADVQTAHSLLGGLPYLPESFNSVFLVDDEGTLAGCVPLSKLVLAGPREKLIDLTMEPLLSVPPDASENDVVELIDKYNLLSLAVVDAKHSLVGIVTVDDVVSLLRRKG